MSGMSDAEVQGQIAHMIAFIDQEASEKVEEIDAKAEEEFNLEKGRLVQQGRSKVQEHHEKKMKNIDLQVKIQQSNLKNQSRLKILGKQYELMQDCYDDQLRIAKETVNKDPAGYKKTLADLTVGAMTRMMEEQLFIQCRPQDIELMKSLIPECERKFSDLTKAQYKTKLYVDEENPLSPDLIGGVIVRTKDGKIRCTNTLNSRLDDIMMKKEPELRELLFGPNPNRRFKD